jgi:hypothetical protein
MKINNHSRQTKTNTSHGQGYGRRETFVGVSYTFKHSYKTADFVLPMLSEGEKK